MKNFRYKKYIPNELGKIIFFEEVIPKKVLKQQFFSNLFSLFFSIFGLMICLTMFYHFITSNDLFGLIFALLFSPFFYYLYKSVLDFFIIEISFFMSFTSLQSNILFNKYVISSSWDYKSLATAWHIDESYMAQLSRQPPLQSKLFIWRSTRKVALKLSFFI